MKTKFFKVSAEWMKATGQGDDAKIFPVISEQVNMVGGKGFDAFITVERNGCPWIVAAARGEYVDGAIPSTPVDNITDDEIDTIRYYRACAIAKVPCHDAKNGMVYFWPMGAQPNAFEEGLVDTCAIRAANKFVARFCFDGKKDTYTQPVQTADFSAYKELMAIRKMPMNLWDENGYDKDEWERLSKLFG